MIFAFSLIAMATIVMTVFALSIVRGLLGIGQFLGKVRAPQDADGSMRSCGLPAPSRDRVKKARDLFQERSKHETTLVLVVLSLAALLANLAWAGSVREDATERLQNSADVLKEIAAAPDKGIPDEVVKNSKCIVVVPHLIKAGFIVGAKHGRGVAVCRTSAGWSAPAFISVGGGSWGLQIGAEGVDLVMLVMNDSGLRHLLSSKFEITGEGSAAAGPVGRHASAGTDWKLNTELLTYSRSRGIFAGSDSGRRRGGAGRRRNRGDLWQRHSLQEDLDGRGCRTRSSNVLLTCGGSHQSSGPSGGSPGTGASE